MNKILLKCHTFKELVELLYVIHLSGCLNSINVLLFIFLGQVVKCRGWQNKHNLLGQLVSPLLLAD